MPPVKLSFGSHLQLKVIDSLLPFEIVLMPSREDRTKERPGELH
jgi:hypothetical protein